MRNVPDAIPIRRATPADAAALGALHVASWRETYPGLVPAAMLAALSAEERAAMWGRVLADPAAYEHAVVLLAEDEARLVGFASGGRQRDTGLAAAGYDGEIGAIYLLQSHQGRGIGLALMSALAGALISVGYTGASLWVLRENAVARRFYEALGGAAVGEKADAHGEATLVEVAYGWRDLTALGHRSGE